MDLRPMARLLRKAGLDARAEEVDGAPTLLFKHQEMFSAVIFMIDEDGPDLYAGILFSTYFSNDLGLDEVDANEFNTENQLITMFIEDGRVKFNRLHPIPASEMSESLFLHLIDVWLRQQVVMMQTALDIR